MPFAVYISPGSFHSVKLMHILCTHFDAVREMHSLGKFERILLWKFERNELNRKIWENFTNYENLIELYLLGKFERTLLNREIWENFIESTIFFNLINTESLRVLYWSDKKCWENFSDIDNFDKTIYLTIIDW